MLTLLLPLLTSRPSSTQCSMSALSSSEVRISAGRTSFVITYTVRNFSTPSFATTLQLLTLWLLLSSRIWLRSTMALSGQRFSLTTFSLVLSRTQATRLSTRIPHSQSASSSTLTRWVQCHRLALQTSWSRTVFLTHRFQRKT